MSRELTLDLPKEHGLNRFSHDEVDSPEFLAECAKLDHQQAVRRDRYWKSEAWRQYIFIHVREHRWHALQRVAAVLSKRRTRTLCRLFREVWVDSEDIWRQRRRVSALVKLIGEENRKYLFRVKDWRTFQRLPETLTVYRGAKTWNLSGMCWSVSADGAAYYAMHTHHAGLPGSLDPKNWGSIYETTIKKDSILFYTDQRNEGEVITRRFIRGRLSPEGQIGLASMLGAGAALQEYERQKSRLSLEALAEYSKRVAFWTEVAKDEQRTA